MVKMVGSEIERRGGRLKEGDKYGGKREGVREGGLYVRLEGGG